MLRLNEKYIKSIQEIINWHDFPIESRIYPESLKQNRSSFKLKAKRYELDKTHGILFYSHGVQDMESNRYKNINYMKLKYIMYLF